MISHSVQKAFDEFQMRANMMSASGVENVDIGAVLTPAVIDTNILRAQIWGTKNLPGGLASADDSDWWFLSFSNCLTMGALEIDPTYLPKCERLAAFKKFSNSISAEDYKKIYLNDESYVQKLSEEQRDALARIGGQRGFKFFVNYDERKV
jgi:hypothetical protein